MTPVIARDKLIVVYTVSREQLQLGAKSRKSEGRNPLLPE